MTASPWTDELFEEARYLYLEQKFSAAAIANILFDKYQVNFTRNAIIGKMKRAGAQRGVVSANLRNQHTSGLHPVPMKKAEPLAALLSTIALVPEVARERAPLLELADDGCKFECGGQEDVSAFLFCNQPAVDGLPYCRAHCRRAYFMPKPKKKNLKEAA